MSLFFLQNNNRNNENLLLTQATLPRVNVKKEKMHQRLIVGIFIVIFLVLFFLFAILADQCNNWSWLGNESSKIPIKFIFAIIDVVAISSLIFFVNFELRTTFYKNNIFAICFFSLINLFFFYGISLFYLSVLYFANHNSEQHPYSVSSFVLPIIGWLVLVYVCVIVLGILGFMRFLRYSRADNLFFPLAYIHLIVIPSIATMVYFLFISGWTTFIFLMIISMSTDTMAYVFGSFFGKNKLSPKISPNKTWEGAIYSILTTLVLALILIGIYTLIPRDTHHHVLTNIFLNGYKLSQHVRGYIYYWWISAGLIVVLLSVFDIIGDLVLSSFKRKFLIKDYSSILKAHGGILDRIDGLTCVFFVYSIIWITICLSSGPSADLFNPNLNNLGPEN